MACLSDSAPEQMLVFAAKNGDELALESLFKCYQQKVLRVVLRNIHVQEDAEDIVQQSFQKAFLHLCRFEGKSSFSTWLTRFAMNEALMFLRGIGAMRKISIDESREQESTSSALEMSVQRELSSVNCQGVAAEFSKLHIAKRALASLLALVLLLAANPQSLVAQEQPGPRQASSGPQYQEQTPEQLQQLVAPIALYPDSLVAQILAASTFPEQVVDADRWVQSHPDLKGAALAQAVDQLPWDPSVKALVAFPSILGNMDKNLSWTSSLGDAYYNQEQDVMDAVQVMRRRAQEAGHLNSTSQQTVTREGSDIEIEPVSPEIVYVPAYDPWVVYGGPIVAWPGWYPYPGIWYDGGPVIFFGVGYGIGFYGGYGWGWHHWGCDWHHHYAVHDHERYYSQSRTFYNRDRFYRGEAAHGVNNPTERAPEPFAGNHGAARGYAEPRAQGDAHSGAIGGDRGAGRGESGVRSGAFSGFGRAGEERSFSSRGSTSFGGGIHGGGGFHGGGRH